MQNEFCHNLLHENVNFSLICSFIFLNDTSARTESRRSRLPRPIDFSTALYTFDIGQDDITHGLRKLGAPQLRTALPDIVNQLATAVTVSLCICFFH